MDNKMIFMGSNSARVIIECHGGRARVTFNKGETAIIPESEAGIMKAELLARGWIQAPA